jgi:hypothetical protein
MYNFRISALVCVLIAVLLAPEVYSGKLFAKHSTTPLIPTSTDAWLSATTSFEGPARDLADGSQGDSTLTRLVGSDVRTRPYDPMLYEGQSGGPVKGGDDLECKSGQVCCWSNSDKSSSTTMKWQSAKGATDPSKMQSSFNTQKAPDDNYLVAYSDKARGPNERALFESCSIACAEGNVEITFRYWATAGVQLQVCNRDAFFGDTDTLSNCRPIQTNGKQTGTAKATVPGGQLQTLDLVASSFTNDQGSVVIIDRINVSFKPCSVGANTQKPQTKAPKANTPAPSAAAATTTASTSNDDPSTNCPALQCSFDQDFMCGFREYQVSRANAVNPTKGFAVRHGRFENLLTGVAEPRDQGAYAAAYLFPDDSASLQTSDLKISSPRILRFNGYVAAQGLRLKICLDNDNNCPLITSSDVKVTDRKRWKTYNVVLPKGTNRVYIIAENTGTNQGAVGIDNVELFRPLTSGPVDAEQPEGPACSSSRTRTRHF